MSSDRPGGPAHVVPGDEPGKPDETVGDGASSHRSRKRGKAKKGSLLRELRGKAAKIKEKRDIISR